MIPQGCQYNQSDPLHLYELSEHKACKLQSQSLQHELTGTHAKSLFPPRYRDKDENKSSVNTVWICLWIDPSVCSVFTCTNSLFLPEKPLWRGANDRCWWQILLHCGKRHGEIRRLWSKNRYPILDAILGFFMWIIKALSLIVCVCAGVCVYNYWNTPVEHLLLQWRVLKKGQGQGSIYHRLLLRAQCVSAWPLGNKKISLLNRGHEDVSCCILYQWQGDTFCCTQKYSLFIYFHFKIRHFKMCHSWGLG